MSAADYARAEEGQRQAADPEASVFVTANAGSGKTKVLIDRVARLLLAGGAPSSFLCITYTKAAAAEMQRRLFARLGVWSVADDAALRRDLRALLGGDAPLDDAALSRARALFAQALETPGGLRIQTIHAFCERLLKRFPLEAGVPAGFAVADETEAQRLLEQAWARAIEARPAALAHLAEKLHYEALEELRRALLARRDLAAAHLRDGLAAAEAQIAARHGVNQDRDSFVAHFLAAIPWSDLEVARAQLDRSGKADQGAAALIAAARTAAGEAQLEAYFDIFLTKGGEPRANVITRKLRDGDAFLDALFTMEERRVQSADAALKAIDRADDMRAVLNLGEGLIAAYANAKAAVGALDFDDLIARAQRLLGAGDAAAWVLYKLDGAIEHVLIDEGQDTSPAQWALIEPIQSEFFAGLGAREKPRTVFAVGDPKQSIYSFQGADPERFLGEAQRLSAKAAAAERRFSAPQLSMSFRSTQTVLDAVDATFADVALAAGEPEASNIARHRAHRTDEGLVEWWPLAQRPARREPRAWDAPLDIESGVTAPGVLARTLAEAARGWIAGGETVRDPDTGARRAMRAGDILVLVRQRGPVFDEMLRAFKRAGVEVAGADQMRLNEELAVQDLLALMRTALDPLDDLSLAETLKGPFVGLDDDDLIQLAANRAADEPLIARLQAAWAAPHREAADFVRGLIAARAARPYDFLARVLETPDAHGRSGWTRLFARLGSAARDPVEETLTRALGIGERGPAALQHLLAAIETDDLPVKRELEAAGEAARVMTAHGAKGLEAPVVILADTTGAFDRAERTGLLAADCELYWSPRKADDDAATQGARAAMAQAARREHARLLYVAMTRARDRLIVCGAALGNRKEGRADGAWHEWVEAGVRRAGGAPCETPFGEGLRLGGVATAAPALAAAPAPAPLPRWMRKPAPPAPPARRALNPSRLLEDVPAFTARAPGRRRFRRGRLIHGLLERLPDLAEPERGAAAAAWLKARGVEAGEAAVLAREALGVLGDPAFAAIFAPGSRAEAPIVAVLANGARIAGVVDRLAVTQDEVFVLDFKTDRPAPRDPAALPASYLAQMAAYAAALRAAFPAKRVRCAFLWTEAPALMEIPPERLAEAAVLG